MIELLSPIQELKKMAQDSDRLNTLVLTLCTNGRKSDYVGTRTLYNEACLVSSNKWLNQEYYNAKVAKPYKMYGHHYGNADR